MSNLLNEDAFNALVKEKFPSIIITNRVLTIGSEAKIYLFFISFENEGEIKNLWTSIRNFIAFEIQSTITDDFSKWNFYLFFRIKETLEKELKYKIENDTFSSRKIVVDFKSDMNQVIKDHIINSDLEIQKTVARKVTVANFEKNIILENALNGKRIKGKRNKTEEVWDVLNEINLSLKKSNHES